MKAFLLFLIAGVALTGCASPKAAKRPDTSAQEQLLTGALRCLISLQMQGKAPGLPKADRYKYMDARLSKGPKISYPASVIIRARDPNNFICTYTVVKDTADSPWRLAAGTRSSEDGHVIEELVSK